MNVFLGQVLFQNCPVFVKLQRVKLQIAMKKLHFGYANIETLGIMILNEINLN